jgi:hypothetical protein
MSMQAKNVIALGAVVMLLWALMALSAGGPSDEKSSFLLPTPPQERLEPINSGGRGQIGRDVVQNAEPARPGPIARAAQVGKFDAKVENQLHSAREAAAQSATVVYYLGADARVSRAPNQKSRSESPSAPRSAQPQAGVQARAIDRATDRDVIASVEEELERRQHMARQRIAERWTARVYAALEKTLQTVAAQTDEEAAKSAEKSDAEARVEDRQGARRAQAAAPATADLERGGWEDANRIVAEQAANNEAIASAEAERAAKNSTDASAEALLDDGQHSAREDMARHATNDRAQGIREETDRIVADLNKTLQANAAERVRLAQIAQQATTSAANAREDAFLDDRQHSARERTARRTTAELAQIEHEEADRIVADLNNTLQARAVAAAAERLRVAQIDAEARMKSAEQATKSAANARQDALLDGRQHNARERAAQRATDDLARGRREEADQIVADLNKTLQANAVAVAAKRVLVAQIDAESRMKTTEQAIKARQEALVDDRQHIARERMARRTTDDLVRGRREEADRIVANLDKTLQARAAAASAERVRLAQIDVETRATPALAPSDDAFENLLHAARLQVARLSPSRRSDTQKLGLARETPKQLSPGRAAQQVPQPETNDVDLPSRRAAALASSGGWQNRPRERGKTTGAAGLGVSSVASVSLAVSMGRRCPSILASEGEYDDDLVSLCRTWSDWR